MAELVRGTIVAHIYEVESPLGSGGFGATYLARNTTLKGGQVVVKQVASEDQGEEEAQVLVGLQSANVVRVLAFDEKHRAIVMERASGEPLADLLPKLSLVESVRIAREVAVALSELEARELVHRDVKPENVMVTLRGADGRLSVKLIDFGIALKAGKPLKGDPVGSPLYCPAEQHERHIAPHPADDVYALGGVLFHMLTGQAPYVPPKLSAEQRTEFLNGIGYDPALADSAILEALQLRVMHQSAPVPTIFEFLDEAQQAAVDPELLHTLDELLQRMLSKQRQGRPRAREIEHVLERLDGRFSSGATQVGFKMRSQSLPTSTLVLPKRIAPKATNLTPEGSLALAAPTAQLAQQLKPGVPLTAVLGLAALLLGGGLVFVFWPRPQPPIETPPVIVAPPEKMAEAPRDASVAAVVVAAVVVDAGAEAEDLSGIRKPVVKPSAKPAIAAIVCDDRWKRASEVELAALSRDVAKKDDDALWVKYQADEERVMKKMLTAQSAAGCAVANEALDQLQRKYGQ
ncbi:MAG: serine/threonine protein kinase [Archangiaceae bacterium]|nr:serine/threonine protein kinase [Archangiaceae bacterium]